MNSQAGYGKPPVEHRFRKGQSGNPAGRPRGSKNARRRRAHILDEMATLEVKGQKVTRSNGDWIVQIARAMATQDRESKLAYMLTTYERRMKKLRRRLRPRGFIPVESPGNFRNDGNVHNTNEAVRALEIGTLMWRTDARARIKLDTWIVQMALDRMDDRQLSLDEQREVLRSTRSAWRLDLPAWWSPEMRASRRGRIDQLAGEDGPEPVRSVQVRE